MPRSSSRSRRRRASGSRSMREHFRRFFPDAANDVADRVAAEEKRECGAPDARQLRCRCAHERYAAAFDEKDGGLRPADAQRWNVVTLRKPKQLFGARCRDDRARLRLAEQQRDGVELISVSAEIDVT